MAVVSLAFALVGCAANATSVGSPATGLPDDPCGLVSVSDVEAATGSVVLRTGIIPDERLIERLIDPPPSGVPKVFQENPCDYVTDGRHGSITVFVDPEGGEDFADERARDPRNTEDIDGVGDAAFAHGLASLHVRVGDGYFVLTTQHGAGWDGIADLEALALAAISRLA